MSLDFEAKRQWLQSTSSWHQGRRRRFFDDGWSVDATGKITAAIYRYCRLGQRNTSVMSRPRSLNRQRAGQRFRKGFAASAEFDDFDGCVGVETKPALVFAPEGRGESAAQRQAEARTLPLIAHHDVDAATT